MWQKVQMLPLAAYMAVTGFFQDLKKDERGLSGVVVAVLLILIAIFAIVFLWAGLSGLLSDWWTQISNQSDSIKPIT